MKPKRLALYVAGAAIAVSAAYFFWPDLITAASTFEKSAASTAKGESKAAKGETKGESKRRRCRPRARHGGRGGGSRHAGDPVCAGHRRAARQRRRQAARRRTDHRGGLQGRRLRRGEQCPVPARRSHGQGADQPGRGDHLARSGRPARCRGHASPAPVSDRQQGRDRSRARSGQVCRRGVESRHHRRAGIARTRSARSSTTSPSARRSAAAPAA